MGLWGVMDGDGGVAVGALVGRGGVVGGKGRPPVALGDDERAIRQHGGQRLRQLAPEARRQAVWRGGEGESGKKRPPRGRPGETPRGPPPPPRPPPPGAPRGSPRGGPRP